MHLVYPPEFKNSFQFLLGITVVPREIEDNSYAKFFWGANKVNYGLCENGELLFDVFAAVAIACVTDVI